MDPDIPIDPQLQSTVAPMPVETVGSNESIQISGL